MTTFQQEQNCFIAGSTWPEDEAILVPYINASTASTKFVIAPHNIKSDQILALSKAITKRVILYSEIADKALEDYDVLLIDTIGLLTKIYSYAHIAYVGGGFGTKGLHNTLEPAVFGIPVLIGPNYTGFKEAEDLVAQKGIVVVNSKEALEKEMTQFLSDSQHYTETGTINSQYVDKSKGATSLIMRHIQTIVGVL